MKPLLPRKTHLDIYKALKTDLETLQPGEFGTFNVALQSLITARMILENRDPIALLASLNNRARCDNIYTAVESSLLFWDPTLRNHSPEALTEALTIFKDSKMALLPARLQGLEDRFGKEFVENALRLGALHKKILQLPRNRGQENATNDVCYQEMRKAHLLPEEVTDFWAQARALAKTKNNGRHVG